MLKSPKYLKRDFVAPLAQPGFLSEPAEPGGFSSDPAEGGSDFVPSRYSGRAYGLQAVEKIKDFTVSAEAATKGTIVVCTATYGCTPGGTFGDGCDARVIWRLIHTDTGEVVDEVQEPDANGFNPLTIGGQNQSAYQFRMPDYNVTIQFILKQANISFGLVSGDRVADQRSASVTYSKDQQQLSADQGTRSQADWNAFLAGLVPWVPWLAVAGIAVAGLVIAGPPIVQALSGKHETATTG